MAKPAFTVGDRVRLTGQFLRSTGHYTGHDAHTTWTVMGVDTLPGLTLVAIDEPSFAPTERYRRINAANLILASRPDHS